MPTAKLNSLHPVPSQTTGQQITSNKPSIPQTAELQKAEPQPAATISTNQTNSLRQQQLQQWLQQVLAGQRFELHSLPGDASHRRYHRIYLPEPMPHQPAGYIVMDAPPELESITEFVTVAELMAACVNVPDIAAKDMDNGFLLLQDFGGVEFAHLLPDASTEQVTAYYQYAMQALIQLQSIDVSQARQAGLADYDAAMLQREMTLFVDWFLPYVGVVLDSEQQRLWQAFCDAIISAVLAQPQVLVHRDYHSRNLMLDDSAHPQHPQYPQRSQHPEYRQTRAVLDNAAAIGVIDFQDAVIGAYSYDVVSLLRDAYVDWSEQQVSDWLAQFLSMYRAASAQSVHSVGDQVDGQALSFHQFYADVSIMGIQRHLKVLGIFVRLAQRDGKLRYLADIPKVMRDLLYELQWLVNYASEQPNSPLASLAQQWLLVMQKVVQPRFEQTFSIPE